MNITSNHGTHSVSIPSPLAMTSILSESFTSSSSSLLPSPYSRNSSVQSLIDVNITSSTSCSSSPTHQDVAREEGLLHAKIRLDAKWEPFLLLQNQQQRRDQALYVECRHGLNFVDNRSSLQLCWLPFLFLFLCSGITRRYCLLLNFLKSCTSYVSATGAQRKSLQEKCTSTESLEHWQMLSSSYHAIPFHLPKHSCFECMVLLQGPLFLAPVNSMSCICFLRDTKSDHKYMVPLITDESKSISTLWHWHRPIFAILK